MNSLSKLNYKIISHLMGLLIMVNGGFMLLAACVSWYYADGTLREMILAGATALCLGGMVMLFTKNHRKEIQKRDGYIIVTFGWIFMALIGTLPYIFTGTISSFTNAFFETMS